MVLRTNMMMMSHMLERMTRQMSAPVIWDVDCCCACSVPGMARGVAPAGRGRRMGVVVGSVVISTTPAPAQSGGRTIYHYARKVKKFLKTAKGPSDKNGPCQCTASH